MRYFKKNIGFINFIVLNSILIISLTLSGGCGSKFEKGTKVCSKWGTTWYLAEITGKDNGKYNVKYYDGTQGNVSEAEIKTLLEKQEIKVGDQVLAVWQSGIFYPGIVTEIKADGFMIKWDDGSETSLAKFGEIAKK